MDKYTLLFCEACSYTALDEDMVYTEGTNMQSFKLYRNAKSAYKDAMKAYHKSFKAAKYDEARRALDNGIDAINDFIFAIKSTKDSTASTILGIMLPTLTGFAYMTVPALLVIGGAASASAGIAEIVASGEMTSATTLLIPSVVGGYGLYAAGAFAGVIAEIADFVNNVVNTANKIKDRIADGGDVNFSDFNLFRNDVLAKTKKLKKILTDAKERVDEVEKSHKAYEKKQEAEKAKSSKAIDKAAKMESSENEELDTMQDAIFEAYIAGKIDEPTYRSMMSMYADVM